VRHENLRRRARRGFTLVEMAVVVAIVAALAALAYSSLSHEKPRADLASATVELASLIHQARQSALASGDNVAVLVYPNYVNPGVNSTGYFIVYQDACFDFFTGGATCGVSYASYAPATPAAGGNGTYQSLVLDTMTLPYGIVVGPAAGMGAGAALVAPLAAVQVNTYCSFCGTTGGAVQFSSQGQASFYRLDGSTVTGPLTPNTNPGINVAASLSLGYDPTIHADMTGQRTLVIFTSSGAVQTINGG